MAILKKSLKTNILDAGDQIKSRLEKGHQVLAKEIKNLSQSVQNYVAQANDIKKEQTELLNAALGLRSITPKSSGPDSSPNVDSGFKPGAGG